MENTVYIMDGCDVSDSFLNAWLTACSWVQSGMGYIPRNAMNEMSILYLRWL